ncbi:hypothetical protein [Grimontia sp. SpTr1]|uniref:hypothetical protein n=1 Tax=Grimontia sp. SpTr1 TaxID=2995319 RepID=UPI00248CF282|nr:hypothetical protein [Grimontia sp. SpTr1]
MTRTLFNAGHDRVPTLFEASYLFVEAVFSKPLMAEWMELSALKEIGAMPTKRKNKELH